jgi:hypothetical protein
MEKGYDVTVLSDAIGASAVPAYEAAIRLNFPLIGNAVIMVEVLFAAVDCASIDGVTAQVGEIRFGARITARSDHGRGRGNV